MVQPWSSVRVSLQRIQRRTVMNLFLAGEALTFDARARRWILFVFSPAICGLAIIFAHTVAALRPVCRERGLRPTALHRRTKLNFNYIPRSFHATFKSISQINLLKSILVPLRNQPLPILNFSNTLTQICWQRKATAITL